LLRAYLPQRWQSGWDEKIKGEEKVAASQSADVKRRFRKTLVLPQRYFLFKKYLALFSKIRKIKKKARREICIRES
jgi:hypothetical protein